MIEKYNLAEPEAKQKVLGLIVKAGGAYVSGAEKIEFVMSKLSDTYRRDRLKDSKTIKFYANTRNSIHNFGKNGSAMDFRQPTANGDLTLLSGQPMTSHDYSDITRLCGDLVEVYFAVFEQNADLDSVAFIFTG